MHRTRDASIVMAGLTFLLGAFLLLAAENLLLFLCAASAAALNEILLVPFEIMALGIVFVIAAVWSQDRLSRKGEDAPSRGLQPPPRSLAPSRGPSLLFGATLALVLLFVLAFVALVLVAANARVSCAPCEGPILTGAITMTATVGGTCHDSTGAKFSTFTIAIGGATRTMTTTDFGFTLTVVGDDYPTPPGSASSPDNCVRSPTSADAWIVVLISPGGATDQALWSQLGKSGNAYGLGGGWSPLNSTLPVTITGGQTLLIVAGGFVDLAQATMEIYGVPGSCVGGQGVTGSVTL